MAGETLLVTLRNVQQGERLYADWPLYAKDAQHRSVFTCRNKNETGDVFQWKLSGVYVNGVLRVRLASKLQNGEKLFAPTEAAYMKDSQRRFVYTASGNSSALPDETFHWFLEADSANNQSPISNRYMLVNVLSGEVLYSPADDLARDSWRRNVFTWRGNRTDFDASLAEKNKGLWDIKLEN